MSTKIARIMKWVSLPVLFIGSMFSSLAGDYELLVNSAICLGALIVIHLSLRVRDHFFAAGCVAVAVVFSPLGLVAKMFFLIGLIMIAAFVVLVSAVRAHPLAAPASIVVGAGSTAADFTLQAGSFALDQSDSVMASYGGSAKSVAITPARNEFEQVS